MDSDTFRQWLDDLGSAWQSRDPDAAAQLCAENVHYHEDPFQEPLIGREAVRQVWQEVPTSQKDIEFSFDILAVTEHVGVAHWSAAFTRLPSGTRSELDGVYTARLDERGLCVEFHQWWNAKGT